LAGVNGKSRGVFWVFVNQAYMDRDL